jgi:MoxR-like ATPase
MMGTKHPGEEKLVAFMEYAQAFNVYQERSREIDMLTFAVLCKEHVLFQGVAGTAKSELSRQFFRGIRNARAFEQQFTAFMDETYVFGPQVIDELVKKGNVIHNTKDSLADTEFALLDEFFNANEELVVACNEVFNERTFTRNQQKEKCPLITAVMTTNQDRQDEVKLKPIYDRIMFTSTVMKVSEAKNRARMLKSSVEKSLAVSATYDYADLADVYDYIDQCEVEISDSFVMALDKLCTEFQKQSQKYISDRKEAKTLRFLRVIAIMDNSMELTEDHLAFAKYAWVNLNVPKEETAFDSALASAKAWLATEAAAERVVSSAKKSVAQVKEQIARKKSFSPEDANDVINKLNDIRSNAKTEMQRVKGASSLLKDVEDEIEKVSDKVTSMIKVPASSKKKLDSVVSEVTGSTTEELMSDDAWLDVLKGNTTKTNKRGR